MNYVVDKVKEEQKEDVSILTHPRFFIVVAIEVIRIIGLMGPIGLISLMSKPK